MSGRILSRRTSFAYRGSTVQQAVTAGTSDWVALAASATTVGVDVSDAVDNEWIYLYAAAGLAQSSWSFPGWTLLDSGNTASSGFALFRYKKTPGDTMMELTVGTATKLVVGWQQYIGLHTTTPDQPTPPATQIRSSASNTSATASASAPADDRWAVGFFYARTSTLAESDVTFTVPSGLTERVSANNNVAASAPWAGLLIADSGAPVTAGSHSYQAAASFTGDHGAGTLLYLIPADGDPGAEPDPGPTPTKVLPGMIDGISPESNDFIGPVMDTNGNMYAITETSKADDNQPKAMKSADGGQTWVEMDAANRSTSSDTEAIWLVKDVSTPSLLHIAHMDSGGRVRYHSYRMSDHPTNPDKWLTTGEHVHEGAVPDASDQCLVLTQRTNGDLYLFYRTDPENIGGTDYERIAYRRKSSGGAWSAQVLIESGLTASFEQVSAVRGANNKIHLFYKNMTAGEIWHRSLSSSDVLSSAETVNGTSISTKRHLMSNAVYQDIGGTERVSIAWINGGGADILKWSYVDNDGTPSAEQTVVNVAIARDPGLTGNFSVLAYLVVDGPTIYAVYVDKATQDIWYTSNTSLSGWTAPVEISDGVTAQWIFAGLFTHSVANGGKKVIGYIYDDNGLDDDGEMRYNEVILN